ncbi:AAA family ATPase, partial [Candidatus Margulisiibacteriota bacterium]
SDIKGTILPNPEEVVFGRQSVIEDTKSHLNKNQSVLFVGPLGMGKTHLLKHFNKIMGANTLYISSPSPIKGMLTQICDKLNPDWKKQVKTRASVKDILDYIIATKGNQPPILVIDNLNNIKTSDCDTFSLIFDNFTILASADDLKSKLKSVWWKFKQIELKRLTDDAERELIKYLIQNLSVSDYQLLETRIMTLANGLPLAVVDMIHQVSHRGVITRDVVRDIYHEAGIKYRDWTVGIIILWGLAIMFRFVALGTHSFEGYILAGFGMAILGVLRTVFRRLR